MPVEQRCAEDVVRSHRQAGNLKVRIAPLGGEWTRDVGPRKRDTVVGTENLLIAVPVIFEVGVQAMHVEVRVFREPVVDAAAEAIPIPVI